MRNGLQTNLLTLPVHKMKIKVTDTNNEHWYIISKHPKKNFKGFYNLYVKKELDSVEFVTHVVSQIEYEDLCSGKKLLNSVAT
jgi:hypothetical protein